MTFTRILSLKLFALGLVRAVFTPMTDLVQSAVSISGNAVSQAPFAVSTGPTDNNTLTSFFSASCGSSLVDGIFLEVKLASAVQISTILILDAGQAYLEAHPQATGYYNAQVDRDSTSYNAALADSNLSKYTTYYNIYAGTDAVYTNNHMVSSDALAEGPFSFMGAIQYVRIQLNRSQTNLCTKEIISTIRVHSEAEISHLVTSITLPKGGTWSSDAKRTIGLTTVGEQIVYETKITGASSPASVSYWFLAKHSISTVYVISKYVQTIGVEIGSGRTAKDCLAVGEVKEKTSTGINILEFDCAGASDDEVRVRHVNKSFLSIRKVLIFAKNVPARFQTRPPTTLNIVKTQTVQAWQYLFPAKIDAEGSIVNVVSTVGTATFVTALSDRFSVTDVSLATVIVGTYQLTIQASDGGIEPSEVHTITLIVSDPCLDNGISPSTVSPMTTTVGAPVTQTVSATSACGPLTITLAQSYSWLSISQTLAGWVIKVDPVQNSDAGTYPLTLRTSMNKYPSKPVSDSLFSAVINANAPPQFATPLLTPQTVTRTLLPSFWSYSWPTASDAENNAISVSVNVGAATFFTASSTQVQISDLSNPSVIQGTYSIAVTLRDVYSSSLPYTMTLFVQEEACVLNGIAPIVVPPITTRVNSAPGTHTLTTTTECGPVVFALGQSYAWLTLSQAGTNSVINVTPVANSNEGAHSLTLKTSLTFYPQVVVPDSTFTVTILPSTPPKFTSELPLELKIVKPQTATAWSFTLPSMIDEEDDPITLSADLGGAAFVKISQTNKLITIADTSAPEVVVGVYTITITLSDATSSRSYQTSMSVRDPCLDFGIPGIKIPDMTAQVLGVVATHEFSAMTECGWATFSLTNQTFISLSQNETAVIRVAPTDNASQGTYMIVMKTSLKKYPTVVVPNSVFKVTVVASVNHPPMFVTPIYRYHVITKTLQNETWSYTLPKTFDEDGELVRVTFDSRQAHFVSFDGKQLRIANLTDPTMVPNTYTTEIFLDDGRDRVSFEIIFLVNEAQVSRNVTEPEPAKIQEPSASVAVFDWKKAFEEVQKTENGKNSTPPKATLESISKTGLLVITFSVNMANFTDFASIIQNTTLSNGKKAFEFHVDAGALSDPLKLKHQWRVVEYSKRSLQLQIDFETPKFVSMEMEPENAKVIINDGTIFISEQGLPLDLRGSSDRADSRTLADEEQKLLILRARIPTQLSHSAAEKILATALDSASSASEGAMIANFALNMALSASLNQLWTLVNAQQLFVLMPLMKVVLPANVQQFFSGIFQIAAFDFYDTNDMLHELLDIPETDPYNESFGELGFESRYLLNNLGTMVFFFLAIPPQYILFKCLNWCRNRWSCAKKLAKKLRRTLFYSWFITTMFESYSMISICCLISLPRLSFETWGLVVQATVTLFFAVTYITVPYILLFRLSRRMEILQNSSFSAKYGALYEGLRLEGGRWVFLQPAFFLIRRLILAVAVVAVPYLIVQIYLVITQTLINLLIVEYTSPFTDRSQRRMQIFNEVLLILLLYTIMCYSPWLQEVETKYSIGYLSCVLVAFHFVINITIMLRDSLLNLIRTCRVIVAKKVEIKVREQKRRLRQANRELRMEKLKIRMEVADFLDTSSDFDSSSEADSDSCSCSEDSDGSQSSSNSSVIDADSSAGIRSLPPVSNRHAEKIILEKKPELEVIEEEPESPKAGSWLYEFFYKDQTLAPSMNNELQVAKKSVYSGSQLTDANHQENTMHGQSSRFQSQPQKKQSALMDFFYGSSQVSPQTLQMERQRQPLGQAQTGTSLMEFFHGNQSSSLNALNERRPFVRSHRRQPIAPFAASANLIMSRGILPQTDDNNNNQRGRLARQLPNAFASQSSYSDFV